MLLVFQMGRSSNMPQIQPIIERLMEEARPYNRVYVASVHSDLNENDLQRYDKHTRISQPSLADSRGPSSPEIPEI